MPNPRLTGLGCGLFCAAAMFVLACLDRLLFESSPTVYGVLFLLVSALTAVWVRRGDLASVPVVVPIAFAAGLPPLTGLGGGLGAHLMGLLTALAVQAGWLYGGTLVAGLIVTVRKVRLMARKAAERQAAQGGRGPGVQGGRGRAGQDGRGQGVRGGRGPAMAAHVRQRAAQPRPRPQRRTV
ncbi:hypothetical protein SGFS_045350 [Streptomyces graminofaciens]|uniref:DUF6542 domain-containing protein n=1 Tax=Streptomyces graminofaciens TaxID=68212 RepID=A0ABN5VMK6_9ACTN|nr:DUF6542 domain-containing protein [Streptomyces graminofaciens]BBC33241.1 hypothetical protein SGFS_045350 [Streptomyces graminofaciens]